MYNFWKKYICYQMTQKFMFNIYYSQQSPPKTLKKNISRSIKNVFGNSSCICKEYIGIFIILIWNLVNPNRPPNIMMYYVTEVLFWARATPIVS